MLSSQHYFACVVLLQRVGGRLQRPKPALWAAGNSGHPVHTRRLPRGCGHKLIDVDRVFEKKRIKSMEVTLRVAMIYHEVFVAWPMRVQSFVLVSRYYKAASHSSLSSIHLQPIGVVVASGSIAAVVASGVAGRSK